MRKTKIYFTVMLLLCTQMALQAQLSSPGEPRGRDLVPKKSMNYIEMPDANAFRTSTNLSESKKKDLIGKSFDVDLTPHDAGEWFQLDGGRLWKIAFRSTDADRMGVFFSTFELTPGCEVFTYSDTNAEYKGAFTAAQNTSIHTLAVDPLAGNTLIVELWVPDGAKEPLLNISEIHHIYRRYTPKKGSGSCQIDINCDEGLDWQKEKRSVVRFSVTRSGGRFLCSGALINNTLQDGTPYILTANHCISTQEEAHSAIFYFNNELLTCEGAESQSEQSISGSTFKSTGPEAKLDFSLVELSKLPPASFQPYYAGWDRTANIPQRSTTIHHPSGDVKKISKDVDPAIENGKSPNGWADDDNSHFAVYWEKGSTEGGSSGAPVFNENHLYYGDLVGGEASCNTPQYKDLVTKFSLAWDKYPEQTNSLHKWLDPISTGQTQLAPFDPGVYSIDITLDEIVYPKGPIRANQTINPKISIFNQGKQDVNTFNVTLYLNGLLLAQQTWKGRLQPNAFTYVEFPGIASFGQGDLYAEVTLPANLTDGYLPNNNATVHITHTTGVDILFDLVNFPDNKGFAWEVLDEWGTSHYQHSYAAKQQQLTYPFVLPEGCYIMQTTRTSESEPQPYILRNTAASMSLNSGIVTPDTKSISFCTTTVGVGSAPDEAFYRIHKIESGSIHFETRSASPAYVQLIDLSGRVLAHWSNVQGDQHLDLPNLASSVYVLRISNGQETAQERIFYQHR